MENSKIEEELKNIEIHLAHTDEKIEKLASEFNNRRDNFKWVFWMTLLTLSNVISIIMMILKY